MPSLTYTLAVLYALLALIGLQKLNGVWADPPPQNCPPPNDISPCACTVKKNGLDILCESSDIGHINHAMTTLKARNPIIFYLKLRHSNLPKLQGFVFLALDIRHLTIHNSSLALIEETALSSLGKFWHFDRYNVRICIWFGGNRIRLLVAQGSNWRWQWTQLIECLRPDSASARR